MKNLFDYRVDYDLPDCDDLIIRKINDDNLNKCKELGLEYSKTYKTVSKTYTVGFIVCIICIVCGYLSSRFIFGKSASIIFGKNLWAFIMFVVSLAIFVADIVLIAVIDKIIDRSPKVVAINERLKELCAEGEKQLFIPSDCDKIDVFIRNDGFLSDRGEGYAVDTFEIFEENGKLCFADDCCVVGIDKDEISEAVKTLSPVEFLPLTTDVDKYKEYGIKYNKKKGYYISEQYFNVKLTHNNIDYEMLFPSYETDTLKKYVKFSEDN